MSWKLRLAQEKDIAQIEKLIALSVHCLQTPYYSTAQIEGALGTIFAVDKQLISDGTYFVVEQDIIIGCGGWSKRKSLFGGDNIRSDDDNSLLNPEIDAAKIRAFFVHPSWARQKIGSSILIACENAIKQAGFQQAELVATLAGEPLYSFFEYKAVARYDIAMVNELNLPVVKMTKSIT